MEPRPASTNLSDLLRTRSEHIRKRGYLALVRQQRLWSHQPTEAEHQIGTRVRIDPNGNYLIEAKSGGGLKRDHAR